MPALSIGADEGGGVDRGADVPPPFDRSPEPRERRLAALPDALGIDGIKIGQGHDGGDRLAGPLDNDAFPGCRRVHDLPELRPDLERAYYPHGAIIAP